MKDAPIRTDHTPEHPGPAIDMTGTEAHAKLREFWRVPAGGNRRTYREAQSRNSVTGNLTTALIERNRGRTAELESKARKAWALYNTGQTLDEVSKAVQLSHTTVAKWWLKLGLKTRV